MIGTAQEECFGGCSNFFLLTVHGFYKHKKIFRKKIKVGMLGIVVKSCHPSYLVDGVWEDHHLRTAQAKKKSPCQQIN
jgi:hypothetical protein